MHAWMQALLHESGAVPAEGVQQQVRRVGVRRCALRTVHSQAGKELSVCMAASRHGIVWVRVV